MMANLLDRVGAAVDLATPPKYTLADQHDPINCNTKLQQQPPDQYSKVEKTTFKKFKVENKLQTNNQTS
jgi:hypothetical protein